MARLDERDRFLADTLAFVRRLSHDAADLGNRQAASVAAAPVRPDVDLRADMHKRLEAFRNRQRFLEIKREFHFQQAMLRIRAVTEQRV